MARARYSLENFIIFNVHKLFQTTLGRLLLQKELSEYGKTKAYYVCMSKTSDGTGLKSMFLQELPEEHRPHVEMFSRSECCKSFEVEDGEDNIKVVHDIISSPKLSEGSVIFMDEHPVAANGRRPEDWTELTNSRPYDISLIISVQPVRFKPTLQSKELVIKWPETANITELVYQFRSTQSIFSFNAQLQKGVPVQYSGVEARTSDTLNGPSVTIVNMEENEDMIAMKSWIHYQLWSLRCNQDQVTVLHTENTEQDAREIFENSQFKSCLTTLSSFQGCEAPVIVLFFSREKTDNYARLLDMAARGQYKAGIKYNIFLFRTYYVNMKFEQYALPSLSKIIYTLTNYCSPYI